MYRIRAYEPRDAAAIAEIQAAIWPWEIMADHVTERHRTATEEPGNIATWMVAEDEQGRLAGFACPCHYQDLPEGLFDCEMAVHSELRGRGVGHMLWAAVERYVHEQGARELEVYIRGDDPVSEGWALRRGFVLDRVRTESVLDLTTWDGGRFAGHCDRVAAGGARLLSLTKAEAAPYLRAMYECEAATYADVPISYGATKPYETWLREWENDPSPIMAALAVDGDRVVGMSILGLPRKTGGEAGTHYTAVLRAYRGRGIALAVKLLTIEAALAAGAAAMRTNNDPDNPSMLRVNEKLGYRLVPGPKRLKKTL